MVGVCTRDSTLSTFRSTSKVWSDEAAYDSLRNSSQSVASPEGQNLWAVSLGFAVPAWLLLTFARLDPGTRAFKTYLSLAVTVTFVASSIASIVYVWHTGGTL